MKKYEEELEYIVKQFGQFVAIPTDNIKAIIRTDSYLFNDLKEMLTLGLKVRLPMRQLLSYKWPATWWDAVKERFAYDWMYKFIDRPSYKSVEVDEALINTVIPNYADNIRYMIKIDNKIDMSSGV